MRERDINQVVYIPSHSIKIGFRSQLFRKLRRLGVESASKVIRVCVVVRGERTHLPLRRSWFLGFNILRQLNRLSYISLPRVLVQRCQTLAHILHLRFMLLLTNLREESRTLGLPPLNAPQNLLIKLIHRRSYLLCQNLLLQVLLRLLVVSGHTLIVFVT